MAEEQEVRVVSSCLGLKCCICDVEILEAKHISVDDEGDIISICTKCYEKAEKFFRAGGKGKCQT